MLSFLVPLALILSTIFQSLAALIALRGLHLAGSFRMAWVCISIALFLMVERRLLPLWHVYGGGREDPLNTFFGLMISVFMLAGVIGLKKLFQQLRANEEELAKLAHTDYLTGLNNRRHFMEKAQHELSRALRYRSECSILMLDIDLFKVVNDTYGHHVGDTVLQELSSYCQKTVRSIDILGRLGGEEFVVFLPETGDEKALEVAERLRMGIEQTPMAHVGDQVIQVTVSIGLMSGGREGASLDELLDFADQALYEAKRSGRNRVCQSRSLT